MNEPLNRDARVRARSEGAAMPRIFLGSLLLLAVSLVVGGKTDHYAGSGSGDLGFQFPTPTVVGFESSEFIVFENKRSVSLCAFVYEPLQLRENFTVVISTQDGTATSEDYEPIAQTLGPFNQTNRRLCADVSIMNDMICEANPYPEYFTATMVSSNENVTVGLTRTAVIIEDRWEPECIDVTVGFEHTFYSTIEESNFISVCVKVFRPEHVPREVFVSVSTYDGTAKAERDYTPISNQRVGPLGLYSMRRCFLVFILDDRECERRAERFTLTLDTDDPLVSFQNNNVHVAIDGTTEHTDCATVRAGFVLQYYTVREGDGEVTVCVGAFEPQKFGANFTVIAKTTGNSAVPNSDYIPLKELEVGPLNEGSRIRCFSVTIINDGICGDDPGRHFTITLSTYADLVILTPEKTRVFIYDAVDCVSVDLGLDITTFVVREDMRNVEMCATVTWPPVLEREVEVLVNTRDVSAMAGFDYEGISNRLLLFSQDSRHICFNVTIMFDIICNESEIFIVSLTSSQPRVSISPSVGYVLIEDPPLCTASQVGFEQPSYTTYEGADSVELCCVIVTPGFPVTPQFTLQVTTYDGSAEAPSDYSPLTDLEIGPFGPSVSEVCFSISIRQDSVCEHENTEVFSVVVSSRNGEVEVVPSQRVASVFVEDSAVCFPVTLGFEESSYVVRESEGMVQICAAVQDPPDLRREISVIVQTMDDTAASGSDYQSIGPVQNQFSKDIRRLCFNLTVTDDGICDSLPSESLTIQINSTDPNVTLAPSEATVIIRDSPDCTPGVVIFDQAEFISSEDLGVALLCASLSQPSAQTIFLAVATKDHSARAGADYVTVEQELGPFGPSSEQQCLHVLLVQDGVCEGSMTESFDVLLTNTVNSTKVIDAASVLIYDASTCISAAVAFEQVEYIVQESTGFVKVCVEVVHPSVVEREFSLSITSFDGEALAGMDYVPAVEEPLGNFSLTQRRRCFTITIIDDDICEEPEESFSLNISVPEFVNISRDAINIYIDDSGEIECGQVRVGFESTSYIVLEETQQVETCVRVFSPELLQWDFNLTVVAVDGSATGGRDFNVIDTVLNFDSSNTRNCFFISIINDEECEVSPNEQFTVALRDGDPRLVISPSALTVTIDDAGTFLSPTDIDCYPLEIYFTGDTPAIDGDEINILLATRGQSLPQTISCDLRKNGILIQTQDCTSGSVTFSNIRQNGVYHLKATVITGQNSASINRKLRVTLDPTACTAHLINRGVVVADTESRTTVEFTGVGPVDTFSCELNGRNLGTCSSPLQLGTLESGKQVLRITPSGVGCSRTKTLKEIFFITEYSGK